MKATLTSEGQITIPAAIRERLGLVAGDVLDFDEAAPFIKAVVVPNEDEMASVIGWARGAPGRDTEGWLEESRGPVDLPSDDR